MFVLLNADHFSVYTSDIHACIVEKYIFSLAQIICTTAVCGECWSAASALVSCWLLSEKCNNACIACVCSVDWQSLLLEQNGSNGDCTARVCSVDWQSVLSEQDGGNGDCTARVSSVDWQSVLSEQDGGNGECTARVSIVDWLAVSAVGAGRRQRRLYCACL